MVLLARLHPTFLSGSLRRGRLSVMNDLRVTEVVAVLVDNLDRPTRLTARVLPDGTHALASVPVSEAGDESRVLSEYLRSELGVEAVAGEELSSQIGLWPLAGDGHAPQSDDQSTAAARALWVQLPSSSSLPDGWVELDIRDVTDLPWRAGHVAPVLAARGQAMSHTKPPAWPGDVPADNFTLRPLQHSDADAMAVLWGDDDTTRNLGHRALTRPQVELYVRGRLKDAAGGNYIPLSVVAPDEDVVGEARITLNQRWSVIGGTGEWTAGLGFTVRPDQRGSGVGTAVMSALINASFEHLGVVGVRATVFSRSQASSHIMRKLGMRHAGTNVGTFRDLDGSLFDDLQYAMTRDEWVARNQSAGR